MLSNQALSTFPEVYDRFREKKSKYSTFSQRKKYVDYYEVMEIKHFSYIITVLAEISLYYLLKTHP